MELQGLSAWRSRARPPHRLAALTTALATLSLALAALSLALAGLSLAPASASAAATTALSSPPGSPILVPNTTKPPHGYRLTALEVERIAARNAVVVAERRRHPHLVAYEYTRGYGLWQVSWFTPPGKQPQRELIQVYVSDATGRVTQAWTGYQVAWTMARGYPGAFGRRVNALYVWLPMCALFLLPFLPLPWPRRARRRPTLWHLDLLALLGFSISLAFFNHADLGLSVPLVYPFLLYLLVRMLLLAFGRGRPREPLRTTISPAWLAVALVFLIGFRIGLNVTDSNVIDVGYAGVIGANKVLFGDKLYGNWPHDNPQGDTYGPVDYYAYIPANVAFGWSGVWDDLPAAHAAAIAFDLLTMLGLFLLGRRVRGPTLGIVLAYLWAAYPFTLFALSSNSNDALVALSLVVVLLVMRWAPARAGARGVAAAVASLTKFAPLLLAPLFLRGTGDPPSARQATRYVIGFGLAALVLMAYVVATGNLGPFWHDTISYQIGRPAPFSIWGLWGGTGMSLAVEQRLVEGATVALAIAVMFVPRRRGIGQVAALGAAVIIALQLCLTYWFYLYIPWFFPLVAVALVLAHPPRPASGPASATPTDRSLAPATVGV